MKLLGPSDRDPVVAEKEATKCGHKANGPQIDFVDLSFIGMSGVHAGKFMRLLASWTVSTSKFTS